MTNQSHHEINVSKNGRHFFATAVRSAVSENEARIIFREIDDRFPGSEGFLVTCTYYASYGKGVKFT